MSDTLDLVRPRVDLGTFEAAWTSGTILTLAQAIALAHETALMPETQVPLFSPTKTRVDGLTACEREVATLIAIGKSNREIGEILVVSLKTVEAHSTRLRQKLGYLPHRDCIMGVGTRTYPYRKTLRMINPLPPQTL